MMALLRLNTDIPNEVFPSNCGHQSEMGGWRGGGVGKARRISQHFPPHCPLASCCCPRALPCCRRAPRCIPSPRCCTPAHISEVCLLAGAFLEEALALCAAPSGALNPAGTGQSRQLSSSSCTAPCPVPSHDLVPPRLTSGCLLWGWCLGAAPPSVCHWAPAPPFLSAEAPPWSGATARSAGSHSDVEVCEVMGPSGYPCSRDSHQKSRAILALDLLEGHSGLTAMCSCVCCLPGPCFWGSRTQIPEFSRTP